MSSEDFDDEMDMLETSNMGNTISMLKKLDHSDGKPWLSDTDYEELEHIRKIRNYWVHQCYIDYFYNKRRLVKGDEFVRMANKLSNEHDRIYNLCKKIEAICIDWIEN